MTDSQPGLFLRPQPIERFIILPRGNSVSAAPVWTTATLEANGCVCVCYTCNKALLTHLSDLKCVSFFFLFLLTKAQIPHARCFYGLLSKHSFNRHSPFLSQAFHQSMLSLLHLAYVCLYILYHLFCICCHMENDHMDQRKWAVLYSSIVY